LYTDSGLCSGSVMRYPVTICMNLIIFRVIFVFSLASRRRHTRTKRDWSSDVFSSDLHSVGKQVLYAWGCTPFASRARRSRSRPQIGRASCRERVKQSVQATGLKTRIHNERLAKTHS